MAKKSTKNGEGGGVTYVYGPSPFAIKNRPRMRLNGVEVCFGGPLVIPAIPPRRNSREIPEATPDQYKEAFELGFHKYVAVTINEIADVQTIESASEGGNG